jgi:hypothetical protein
VFNPSITNNKYKDLNFIDLFSNSKNTLKLNMCTSTPLFSKLLSISQRDIFILNNSNVNDTNTLFSYKKSFLKNTNLNLKLKSFTKSLNKHVSIAQSESIYLTSLENYNFKTHNSQITLSDLNNILGKSGHPSLFTFNIENNLNMAKQQR